MRIKNLIIGTIFALFSAIAVAQDLPMGIPAGNVLSDNAEKDLSGAYYDGDSLWLVTNKKGYVWNVPFINGMISAPGAQQWKIRRWHDFEAITHDGNADPWTFVLLAEKKRSLFEFTFKGNCTAEKKCVNKGRTWVLPKYMKESSKGLGAEGLTWVPETHFDDLDPTDENGLLCASDCTEKRKKPDNALDGLYLVAHQSGGFVYAFRLISDASVKLYGKYATRAKESAGLEYDKDGKHLYIWHGGRGDTIASDPTVNTFEKAELIAEPNGESPAKLKSEPLRRFTGPNPSSKKGPNLEGIAFKNNEVNSEIFLTADSADSPNNLFIVKPD